ncbi:MAG TPA: hypothetical protein VFQ48_01205, partial [Pseudonocardiaceae bacterium]|nr:hypothetical protein [Pseudonocardiaceae bacterium]
MLPNLRLPGPHRAHMVHILAHHDTDRHRTASWLRAFDLSQRRSSPVTVGAELLLPDPAGVLSVADRNSARARLLAFR